MFDANFTNNPYPTYEALLEHSRIQYVDYLTGAWLMPHYDDALSLLRDPRLSADRSEAFIQQFPVEQRDQFRDLERFMAISLLFKDGSEHLWLRRLLGKAFTPRTIENLRPAISALTDQLIDQLIVEQQAHGQVDIMHAFAHPLPAMVIAQLLGVPAADQPQFVRWSDDLAVFGGSAAATIEMAHRAQDAVRSMMAYFRTIVEDRRRAPQDDFVSLLVSAEEHGVGLSDEEMLAQCTLFLVAGHETTRNMIGNGLLTLLRHPDQLTLLYNQPTLIRRALDEIVRYESPVQAVARVAAEDFELYGQSIKRGQTVLLMIGAGNRDPQHFSDPQRFDITRDEGRPLSFGYGPHICIGMALAYLESEIALGKLLERLPNMELVDQTPQWIPSFLLRGLTQLPVRIELRPDALAPVELEREVGQERAVGAGCPFHVHA